ncbi:MAG: glycosyltransferase family 2 protein [Opitutaceae bacterium]|nr:glycosyltransferase family 2 protein [Cytophagales bacterium]
MIFDFNSAPLVSIVLTSYNQNKLLKRAFESLQEQTYKNIEIIIVDDYSTDGSREWIKLISEAYPEKVKYFLQPVNVGIPKNKNTGFRMANGVFITYLDGDDTYYPNKIEKEVERFLIEPSMDVVYSNFDIREYNGQLIKTWATNFLPEGDIFKNVIIQDFPNGHLHRFEMFKREVMHSLNFYDESFSIYHDLDFMIRYSAQYKVGSTLNIGSSYFMNPSSIVSNTRQWLMTKQHREVYVKLSHLFVIHGMERELKAYLQKSEINLLYSPPQLTVLPYISAIFKQPFKVIIIIKALYLSFR